MTEPFGSVNFTALMLATDAAALGQGLVFDSALGYWRAATAAHRASAAARTQAIAISEYGGSVIGKVSYRTSGVLPASISGLAAGTASWVRMSSAGFIERCTPSGADDLVGKCFADGRVMLDMGVWDSSNYAGGGGGATPGGSVGSVQTNLDGSSFAGLALGTDTQVVGYSGGVAANVEATQVPSGTTGQVVVLGGSGDLAVAPNTSNGDVLTLVAGVPTFATPAGSGAPTNASYVTIALNGSLSAERVLAATAPVTITDGGANGNVTIAWTAPTGTGVMYATSGAMNAAAKTALDFSSDVQATYSGAASGGILVHNGTKYVNQAKGSNSTALTTSNVGAVAWTQLTTAMIAPGTNGQFMETSGGAAAWGNVASFYGSTGTNATTGTFRDQNTGSYVFRNAGNTADQYGWQLSSSNVLTIGCDSAITTSTMVSTLRPAATASIDFIINGSFVGTWSSSTFESRPASVLLAGAVQGFSSLSAPFNFGRATVSMATPTSGSVVLSAAQYSQPFLTYTGATNSTTVAVVPAQSGSYNALATGNAVLMGRPSQVSNVVVNATGKWLQYDGSNIEGR